MQCKTRIVGRNLSIACTMRGIFSCAVLAMVFLLAVPSSLVCAQEPIDGEGEVHVVRVEANFERKYGVTTVATLDLGVLPKGAQVSVEAVLHNRGAEDIQFGELLSQCTCQNAKISREVIAPGGAALLTWHLEVPGTLKQPLLKGGFSGSGKEGAPNFVNVVFSAKVAGLANFGDHMYLFELAAGDGLAGLRLPIICTREDEGKGLSLSASSELEGWGFKLQVIDDQLVAVPEAIAAGAKVTAGVGILSIIDEDGAILESCRVGVRLRKQCEIYPKLIYFRPAMEDDSIAWGRLCFGDGEGGF